MSKEITMSIGQFMEMERGNTTLKEIVQANNLDSLIGEIMKNKRLWKITIINLALLNMSTIAYADEASEAIAQIHNAENQIVPVILAIVGAICTVCCIAEIGKSVMTRKGTDIGQIVLKYIMAFAGACSVPWAFRLITSVFKF